MSVEHDRRSPTSMRRTGLAMVTISVVGVVVALVGTVVAWQLIGQLNGSTRATLDVTIDTVDSVEDTIDLADQLLEATADSIDTASSTLDTLAGSFDAGTGLVDELDDLTTTVGPTLEDAGVTLRQLQDVGTTIDELLDDLSSIPFGPDYEPDQPLGASIGSVADEIEKLPASFDEAAISLDEFGTTLDDIETDVRQLAIDLDVVNSSVVDTRPLIDAYRQNVADAKIVALETRDDLDQNVTMMRLLLVLLGAVFGAGQIVPFWFGRELLDRAADAQTAVRETGAVQAISEPPVG